MSDDGLTPGEQALVAALKERLSGFRGDLDKLAAKIEKQGSDLRRDATHRAEQNRAVTAAERDHGDAAFATLGEQVHKLELRMSETAAVEKAAAAGWAAVLEAMQTLGSYGRRIHDLEQARPVDLAAIRQEMKADREATAAAQQVTDSKVTNLTKALWVVGVPIVAAVLKLAIFG